MNQRALLLIAFAAATCCYINETGAEETARSPNILWIVAENMGPDLGCYGTPLVKTPHVDKLAAEGLRYELAFDTCPVCSPSRSAFMTGMYQTTLGTHHHRSHRVDYFPLPDGVRPITHRLHDAGYYTANVHWIGRGLDWCYDSGDRVPLIIRWPKNFPAPSQYQAGSVSHQVVSLIDVTATTLEFAGVRKPDNMQGRVLLGANAEAPRQFVVSARDRTDDAVNRIRSLRSQRYRYTRNFMPEKSFLSLHRYKYAHFPVVRVMYDLHRKQQLTPPQQALMASRLPHWNCSGSRHT